MFNPDITDLGAFEKAIDFALAKRLELEEALRQNRNVERFASYVAYAIPKFAYDMVQAAKGVYTGKSEAVRRAEEILRARKKRAAGEDSDAKSK